MLYNSILIIMITFLFGCEGSSDSPSTLAPEAPPVEPIPPEGCENGETTSFAQIRPLLDEYGCIGCHRNQQDYALWRDKPNWVNEAINRMELGENDTKRMPPPPREIVSPEHISTFKAFVQDGRKEKSECKSSSSSLLPYAVGLFQQPYGPQHDLLKYRFLFKIKLHQGRIL